MDKKFEGDIEKAVQVVREASYGLWQSLLAINSILITIIVGLLSFKNIQNTYIVNLMFSGVLLLIISSALIIHNYILLRAVYKIIYNFFYKSEVPSEEERKANIRTAGDYHVQSDRNEKITFCTQLAAVLLIIFIVYSLINNSLHDTKNEKLSNTDQAEEYLKEYIVKNNVNEYWATSECIVYWSEDINEDYFQVEIHEKHGENCPGDPNTEPLLAIFKIKKDNRMIERYDILSDKWEELR